MSQNTIFFSYSRDDSNFVMNLAKNLRKAGATIWLDQLDIKPGSRWDSSIEKALASSNTLLVILSKSSVESQNVMDEVSYALGENKKVVPVLLEECDIPFRLKRLQYADFTTDHHKGIQTLAGALNLDKNVTDKLVHVAEKEPATAGQDAQDKERAVREAEKSKMEAAAQQEKAAQAAAGKAEQTFKSKSAQPVATTKTKSKTPIYVGLAVLVLLAVVAYMSGIFDATPSQEVIEEPMMEESTVDTPIDTEPDVVEPTQDQLDWQFAERSNSTEAYLDYLDQYGDEGEYYSQAQANIDALFNTQGFIEYGTVSGNRFTQRYFSNLSANPDDLPEAGDLIVVDTPRNVRNGVIGVDSNTSRNGDVTVEGQIMRVLEVTMSGSSSFWVKIAYAN